MPRAKRNAAPEAAISDSHLETTPDAAQERADAEGNSPTQAVNAATPATEQQAERSVQENGMPNPATDAEGSREEPPKHWGPPYVARFTCPEMGFELGEGRRYKQRVFSFADKPSAEILSELKENGFTYRAAEKTWTIPANFESRELTDELARKWAGPNYVQGIER